MIKKWNIKTGECVANYIGHLASISNIYYNKYLKKLYSLSIDNKIFIWNEIGGEIEKKIEIKQKLKNINIFFQSLNSIDSAIFLISYNIGEEYLYINDILINKSVLKHLPELKIIDNITTTPDGLYMLCSGKDRTIGIVDIFSKENVVKTVDTKKNLTQFFSYNSNINSSFEHCFVSNNGSKLVTVSERFIDILQVSQPFPIIVNEIYINDDKIYKFYSNGDIRIFTLKARSNLVTRITCNTTIHFLDSNQIEIITPNVTNVVIFIDSNQDADADAVDSDSDADSNWDADANSDANSDADSDSELYSEPNPISDFKLKLFVESVDATRYQLCRSFNEREFIGEKIIYNYKFELFQMIIIYTKTQDLQYISRNILNDIKNFYF